MSEQPARDDDERRPSEVIAGRVRALRMARGWDQARLSERLAEVGFPIDRAVLSKIETGGTRQAHLTVDECFAFADALVIDRLELLDTQPGSFLGYVLGERSCR